MITSLSLSRATRRLRHGFLLPIVLVVVAMLGLAVSIFAEQMLAEYRVTHSLAAQLVAGNAADSGVEFALWTQVQQGRRQTPVDRTGQQFAPRQLTPSQASFMIVSNRLSRDQNLDDSLGMYNESGKLNLNGLPTDQTNILPVRERLMKLPRMTAQIADAIMDWIDSDDQPRPLGAETNWYSSQRAERLPAQGPLRDLAELLHVRGVTRELLYGEDVNGNQWLDDNEDDGELTPPLDNQDGVLDRGWSAYLTVVASESNLSDRADAKIDLNGRNLAQLYDQLLPLLGQEATTFVVALRLEGPRQKSNALASSVATELEERVRSASDRMKQQLDSSSRSVSGRGPQTRGGLDLGVEPTFRIRSMVDLIDCEVLTFRDGAQELIRSPWETGQIEAALEQLEQTCCVGPERFNLARINLAYAPMEVLRTIPNLNDNLAAAIASAARRHRGMRSVGWLVSESLLTLEQLREVGPYVTVGGNVWSGTAIGWDQHQATAMRRFFVIDAAPMGSRIVQMRDCMPVRLTLLQGLAP